MSRYERIADELRALAHPLRLEILSCVAQDLQEPVVIWRRLAGGEPHLQLALVAYHVKVLEQGNMIRLTRTQAAGNVNRHFYRVSARGRHLVEALGL